VFGLHEGLNMLFNKQLILAKVGYSAFLREQNQTNQRASKTW